jgi:SAM-dependent methyltransferase
MRTCQVPTRVLISFAMACSREAPLFFRTGKPWSVVCMDEIMRFLARSSLLFECFRGGIAKRAPGRDRTGLIAHANEVMLQRHGPLMWARYDSLAHSLWRSQEVTLLRPLLAVIPRPVADFGCGDGSFARLVCDLPMDFGIDVDPDAVVAGQASGMYTRTVQVSGGRIPIQSASCASVVSNSVLEHCADISEVLTEIARIIKPGGTLITTMPTTGFGRQLSYWFGKQASVAVNAESIHVNLLSTSAWRDLLHSHGFTISRMVEHQHPGFTWAYRMARLVGRKGLGRIPGFQEACETLFSSRLRRLVVRSLTRCPPGESANVLIIARRM